MRRLFVVQAYAYARPVGELNPAALQLIQLSGHGVYLDTHAGGGLVGGRSRITITVSGPDGIPSFTKRQEALQAAYEQAMARRSR